MRWASQLRWKLFISHAVILVIAVVVLLLSAQVLIRSSAEGQSPLTLGADPAETGELVPADGSNLAIQERIQTILEQSLLIASFGALAAAVVVSLFISRRIVEPLQELTEVSRRLAGGYYRERTRIRSDDELAQLSRSINQLAEALDRTEQRRLALLADVAHELRTPLTSIEGYMEGLLDGIIPADEQTFTLLRHEASRLRRLTDELALLSRAEAGELPIAPRPCSPVELVSELIARFQPQFTACEVDLQLLLPAQCPQIYADPDRVAQVLINLLVNALRYTPAGGRVTVALEAGEGYVQFAVRDTGIGIAPEHLSHIFERFYRVDKSRARASGGTGIGLTIARHIVYAHGGEIWGESDGLGQGACFYVRLASYIPEFQLKITEEQ